MLKKNIESQIKLICSYVNKSRKCRINFLIELGRVEVVLLLETKLDCNAFLLSIHPGLWITSLIEQADSEAVQTFQTFVPSVQDILIKRLLDEKMPVTVCLNCIVMILGPTNL